MRMSATRCSSWAIFHVSPCVTTIRGLVRFGARFPRGSIVPVLAIQGLSVPANDLNPSTSIPLEKFSPWPNRIAARSEGSWSYLIICFGQLFESLRINAVLGVRTIYAKKDDLPAMLYGQLCSGTERYVLKHYGWGLS